MPAIPASLPSTVGPNPPSPPYPPLQDLKLPESRLGCLLLGGLAGFMLATMLHDAMTRRGSPSPRKAAERRHSPVLRIPRRSPGPASC